MFIIPNEDRFDDCKEYTDNAISNHMEVYQKFSDDFNLGYEFKEDEYHDSSIQIALDGHFSVKIVEDMTFIAFIPRVVTNNQLEWFLNNKSQYYDYQYIGGYAITGETILDVESVHGMEKMEEIMKERNTNYSNRRLI